MAITLSQLIDHHDRELKDAVEKTKDKPTSNLEQMIWNAYYTRLEFHAQALALLRSFPNASSVKHADSCVCPGCVFNRKAP